MNYSANCLLAIGASPLMSSEPDELEDLSNLCDALVINIGCLEKNQIKAMFIAAEKALAKGKPWVLDPVGAGASRLRTETALRLIEDFRPSIVRCNAAEALSLAGTDIKSRGVDSCLDCRSSWEHARMLAERYDTVFSVSGETDLITDGKREVTIGNGHPMMSKVSAMGCSASAITAAFAAVRRDCLSAAADAMALTGIAGEIAAAHSSGPGSLAVNFIDTLSSLNPEEASLKLKWIEIN